MFRPQSDKKTIENRVPSARIKSALERYKPEKKLRAQSAGVQRTVQLKKMKSSTNIDRNTSLYADIQDVNPVASGKVLDPRRSSAKREYQTSLDQRLAQPKKLVSKFS